MGNAIVCIDKAKREKIHIYGCTEKKWYYFKLMC